MLIVLWPVTRYLEDRPQEAAVLLGVSPSRHSRRPQEPREG